VTICYGLLFIFWCEAEPPPPPITVCPPLSNWTLEYQEKLAHEFARLPKGTAIGEALREHIRLREQLRRCKK
jgi:hypothetical protein